MLAVCNGMIRSGSTLLYNVVRSAVEFTGLGGGVGFWDARRLARRPTRVNAWVRHARWNVIKMHDVYEPILQLAGDAAVRICYVHRDLRAVAASAKRMWGYDDAALLKALDHAVSVHQRLRELPILEFRYSELAHNLDAAVDRVAAGLGLSLSEELRRRVVVECSVPAAVQRAARLPRLWFRLKGAVGRRFGLPLYDHDPITLLHPDHVTGAGRDGAWRDLLGPELVAMIERRYGDWLERAGYV